MVELNQLTSKANRAGKKLVKSNLLAVNDSPVSISGRVSAGADLFRHSSLQDQKEVQGIRFGSPSHSSNVSNAGSGSVWQQLLPHSAASAGKLLRGGLLGGLTELLFSGLGDLFGGGHSAPPPLVRFTLPDTKNSTLNVDRGSSTLPGVASPFASSVQSPNQNAQVVQAVREALLTSSKLNDVISEL